MHDAAFESLRRQFAAQFEANEGGYLYRHRQRAAAVQVTTSERDEMVAQFKRTLGRAKWVMFAAIMGMFLIVAAAGLWSGRYEAYWVYGGALVLVAGFVAVVQRAMDAPRERFRHRAILAPSRSAEALREAGLRRTSYFQLLWPTGLFFLAWLNLTRGRDLLTGENLWWTLFLIALVGFMGLLVVRKWRLDRKR